MSMDKRWSELFARLEAVEKQLEELTAVMTEPEKKDSKAPEKKAPVKK